MIYNFIEVTPTLFRSGQPSNEQEWRWAFGRGVRHVLKLNETWVQQGDREARKLGMVVTALTINDEHAQSTLLDPIILDQIDAVIDEAGGGGLLVHCMEGKDRTGIALARWRVRRCGWSKTQAWDEWVACGSHGYAGLVKAWEGWTP